MNLYRLIWLAFITSTTLGLMTIISRRQNVQNIIITSTVLISGGSIIPNQRNSLLFKWFSMVFGLFTVKMTNIFVVKVLPMWFWTKHPNYDYIKLIFEFSVTRCYITTPATYIYLSKNTKLILDLKYPRYDFRCW